MSYRKYSKKGNLRQIVKNPNKKQLRQKLTDKTRCKINRIYLNQEIERRGSCQFCGVILRPEVYQWHHVWDNDPEKRPISAIASRAARKRLDLELSKVVLLCPTCHVTFHADLCCMLEHRQQHIDGTFFDVSDDSSENISNRIETPPISLLDFM